MHPCVRGRVCAPHVYIVLILLSRPWTAEGAITATYPSTSVTLDIPETATACVIISATVDTTNDITFTLGGTDAAQFAFTGGQASPYTAVTPAANTPETIQVDFALTDPLGYDTDPATTSLTFTVQVDEATGDSQTLTVNVNLVNTNDEDLDDSSLVVVEAPGGTTSDTAAIAETKVAADETLFTMTIDDADFDDTVSPVTATLHPDHGGYFAASCAVSGTYPVYDCEVHVVATSVLDYEAQTSYTMDLVLSDGNNHVRRTLTVNVNNVDDETPTFNAGSLPATIEYTENAYGTVLGSPEVIYQVIGVNNESPYLAAGINYYIDPNDMLDIHGDAMFTIDAVTGEISRTTTLLSFEDLDVSSPHYVLPVTVFLPSDPLVNSTQDLTVTVLDVCEPPIFTAPSQGTLVFYENNPAAVDELWDDIDPDFRTGTGYDLTLIDPDAPTGGDPTGAGHVETITYTISNEPNAGLFYLDCSTVGGPSASTYELSTLTAANVSNCAIFWNASPDFESLDVRPEFDLVILANDSCGETHESIIRIGIRNRNDNAPVFGNTAEYDKTIPENSARGHYITTVTCRDPDADPDMTPTYSIHDPRTAGESPSANSNYWFYVTDRTADADRTNVVGDLYLAYPWDRDLHGDTAVVTVRCTDGTPVTTPATYTVAGTSFTTVDVTVTFADRNDNRPTVTTFYNREMPYNAPGTHRMRVTLSDNVASDPYNDLGVNNDFEYRFLAPSLFFSIDSTTGTVSKTNFILGPYQRYDVFAVSYDLGTNPEKKYSPLAVVRIDTYEEENIHIKMTLGVTETYFSTREDDFVNALNGLFPSSDYLFRLHDFYEEEGKLIVIAYALTSDVTETIENSNVTKTYVDKDDLLSLVRLRADGTPVGELQNDASISNFQIEKVEPEFADPSNKRNWWTGTEEGVITITAMCLFVVFATLLIAFLIYYILTMEKSAPPPPPPPKPVPPPPKEEPLKQEPIKKSGPGPQLVVREEDDEEVVQRPPVKRKGEGQRGYDAVTNREFYVNDVTGQRSWVENEGDYS